MGQSLNFYDLLGILVNFYNFVFLVLDIMHMQLVKVLVIYEQMQVFYLKKHSETATGHFEVLFETIQYFTWQRAVKSDQSLPALPR